MATEVTSSESMTSLPEDIIIDILGRLPQKTLLRFKCVSKSWLTTISTSIYEKKFTKIMSGLFYNFYTSSPNDDTPRVSSGFLSLPVSDRKSPYHLDFLPSGPISRVRDCSNGLVLYEVISIEKSYQLFYVCNPATKKWASLPMPKGVNQFAFHQMALAFDPCLSGHYQVLYFPKYGEQQNIPTMMIFSSITKTWEENISLNWEPRKRSDKYPGVLLNGYFYLLDRRHFVVKIDMKEKKKDRVIPVPMCKNSMLLKSGESLLYIMLFPKVIYIHVYCEKSSNFLWTCSVEVQTVLKCLQLDQSKTYRDLEIVAVHLELDLVFFQVDKRLFSFHMKTYVVQELLSLGEEGSQLDVFSYSPSLSSVL